MGIAGVNAFDGSWALLHDEAWRAAEGDYGAQLIWDVTAAEVSMRHVGLPTMLIVKSFRHTEKKIIPSSPLFGGI